MTPEQLLALIRAARKAGQQLHHRSASTAYHVQFQPTAVTATAALQDGIAAAHASTSGVGGVVGVGGVGDVGGGGTTSSSGGGIRVFVAYSGPSGLSKYQAISLHPRTDLQGLIRLACEKLRIQPTDGMRLELQDGIEIYSPSDLQNNDKVTLFF